MAQRVANAYRLGGRLVDETAVMLQQLLPRLTAGGVVVLVGILLRVVPLGVGTRYVCLPFRYAARLRGGWQRGPTRSPHAGLRVVGRRV